ncbi:MAG: PKD domain-containing protein [Sulfurovum sp.]
MPFKISLSILSALIISGCGSSITEETNGTQSNKIPSNKILIANAGEDKSVKVNEYIVLKGEGSSSDGSTITYQWSEGNKILSNNRIFPYPTIISGIHTLQLTITNSSGTKANDLMILSINSDNTAFDGSNQLPIADAGSDKTVKVTDYIVIRGTATDLDGTIVSYQWTKNGTLLSNKESFTFSPTIEGKITLTLTVTDDKGANSTDSMFLDIISAYTFNNPSDTYTFSQVSMMNGDYQIKPLGSSISIDSTISMGDIPKSLYILLSNSSSSSTTPTITTSILSKSLNIVDNSYYIEESPIFKSPQYVDDFDIKIPALIAEAKKRVIGGTDTISARSEDIVGNNRVFYLDNSGTERTTATTRKVVYNVNTNMGSKTLNISVSNDAFGSGCSKVNCVTQDMVDGLADNFLKSGLDNDIYDWVTNIYGEEWGASNGLISDNNEITILLTDIDSDNSPNGGVIGFFWSKDNFVSRYSNEKVMFYIDSVMFANKNNGVWDINGFWAKETITTLAHEFQHMISFYQKEILRSTRVDKWLDEMLSLATEDMLATKLKQNGPRGVSYLDGSAGMPNNSSGKYPIYNINNTLSLTDWSNEVKQYSKVSSFSAFLIRNYGGAKLLHDMIHNNFGDERAVVNAINLSPNGYGKNFSNLLHEWGVAVMLSGYDNIVDIPTYNTGDFSYSTYNSITYSVGSINFFNYNPTPAINNALGTINSNANYFYKVGDYLTGDVTIHLKLNGQTEATLIAI